MWNKLRRGVLRLLTPVGPRYLQPSFGQRMYLLWVFRHFEALPQNVLSRRTRTLIENLCLRQHSRAKTAVYAITDQPVIGTIERVPQFGVEKTQLAGGNEVASATAFSRDNP